MPTMMRAASQRTRSRTVAPQSIQAKSGADGLMADSLARSHKTLGRELQHPVHGSRSGICVRDHHKAGLLLRAQVQETVERIGGRRRIEIARGLVSKHDGWPMHQRPGQCHPLLLTTREGGRLGLKTMAQAERLEQLGGTRLGHLRRLAAQQARHHHILEGGEVRQEMEGLENKAHL